MSSGLQEMMMSHCLNKSGGVSISNSAELSVLERQRSSIKWQQEELVSCNVNSRSAQRDAELQGQICKDTNLQHVRIPMVNPEPGLDIAWRGFENYGMPSAKDFESRGYSNGIEYSNPLMKSCPAVSIVGENSGGKGSILTATEGGKKRKAQRALKVASDGDTKEMNEIKEWAEDERSKVKKHSGSSNIKNKDNKKARQALRDTSKVSEVQKTDYIHVRARRGEATDSHSLAERVRREKISERMKYLQELVPGCNKITGKAGMLDEIINYVQSLQRQVEFLSMKLATLNPQLNFSTDSLSGKEVITPSTSIYPMFGELSEIALPDFLKFNPLEAVSSGVDIGNYQPEMGLQQKLPETYVDTNAFKQSPSAWEAELHNLLVMEFQRGSTSFPSQSLTGKEIIAGSTETRKRKMKI